MSPRQRSNRLVRQRHNAGAALVEFAVFLPIIALFVLSTIEITSVIFVKQSLKIAALEGCRTGIVRGSTTASVEEQVESILESRRIRDYTITMTPTLVGNLQSDEFLTISISAPTASNLPMRGFLCLQNQVTCEVSFYGEG